MHTPPEHSAIVDGEALSLDGLYWPRPYYPTRIERAGLIAANTPAWATATSHTAGWIWTGMGSPLPFAVLRPSQPAISPLERELWRARELRTPAHQIATIAGYHLLDTSSTEAELLAHSQDIDRAATQIFFLRQEAAHVPASGLLRMSARQRERANLMLERVLTLQETYPDITR
ncbi:MAG: hypothetical protein O2828_04015 [Actinomycetota bacterium]|nr:hypothetical protein [Actinomycetota bacterium]